MISVGAIPYHHPTSVSFSPKRQATYRDDVRHGLGIKEAWIPPVREVCTIHAQPNLNEIYCGVHDGRLDEDLQDPVVCLECFSEASDAYQPVDDGCRAEDVGEDGRRKEYDVPSVLRDGRCCGIS